MQIIRLKIAPRLLILGFDIGIGQLAYFFSCFLYFSIVGSVGGLDPTPHRKFGDGCFFDDRLEFISDYATHCSVQ